MRGLAVFDADAKLAVVLEQAQEYLDQAIRAEDRADREFYERIVDLYMKIARELEDHATRQ
jgi:hypothetical protein